MNNVFLSAPEYKKRLTIVGLYIGVLVAIFTSGSLSTLLTAAAADIGGMELFPLASTISGLISIAAADSNRRRSARAQQFRDTARAKYRRGNRLVCLYDGHQLQRRGGRDSFRVHDRNRRSRRRARDLPLFAAASASGKQHMIIFIIGAYVMERRGL